MSLNNMKEIVEMVKSSRKATRAMKAIQGEILFRCESGEQIVFEIAGDMMRLKEESENPEVVLQGTESAIEDVISGKRDITHPIAEGNLTVEKGEWKKIISLSRMFAEAKVRG